MPFSALDISLIVVAMAVAAVVILVYLRWTLGALFQRPKTGVESLVGKTGVALSDVDANGGDVDIEGIIWKAISEGNDGIALKKGDRLVVSGISSLTLIVKKSPEKG